MTIADLVAAVEAGKPAAVAMSHSEHAMLDGVSFFFVGRGGRSAAPLFGLTEKLETGNIAPLIEAALQAAARAA